MSVSADGIRLYLDYTAWASARLVNAASTLTEEELRRDFQTSDHSVLDTLVHVFAADRVWLSRIQGLPRATFIDPEDRTLATLQDEWPKLLGRWKEWAAALTDADTTAKIPFKDLRGNPHQLLVWQILTHVMNHGTHHRGQVSGFLRAMGHQPPPLDMTAYYREMAAAVAAH